MAKKSKLTAMSIRELKTWLDGYCSALGDDWSPTPDQWKMIKDKIFSLEDSEPLRIPSKPQPSRQSPPFGNIPYGPIVEVNPYGGNNPDFQPPLPMPPEILPTRPQSIVGLTSAPALINEGGVMRMPSNVDGKHGPSGFA